VVGAVNLALDARLTAPDGAGYKFFMSKLPALGLRSKIVISLAVVMALFIILTELTVSRLVSVSLHRHAETSVAADGGGPDDGESKTPIASELKRLRRMVLFYMITGAVLALVLGSLAITRIVVRPLGRVTDAVERVAEGRLETEVPLGGASELIRLGVSFNRMTETLRTQRSELKDQLLALQRSSDDLKGAHDRLIRAAKLASVGTLAAGVAHEIGNPIAGIIGLLDALESEPDAAKAASYRRLMRGEIERVDRIIAELLAYARPVRSDTAQPETCDVADVIEQVRSLLAPQRVFDGIDLALNIDEDARRVRFAPDDLTQLLVNLLLNAAQALDGGGRIAIATRPIEEWRPALAVVARPAVELAVSDDGPGIDPAIAGRIFDPFFTSRASGQGSGLGLAICQSICDRGDGEIALDRDHTSGARFVVTLPTADRTPGSENR
jgi:two-component system NtrC family sensor kinase